MKRALGLIALLLLLVAALPGVADAKKAKKIKTASVAATFTVKNTDTSQFSCPSDGATYEVKGHITGPASALASVLEEEEEEAPQGRDALPARPRRRRVALVLRHSELQLRACSRRRQDTCR